jgi:hypothetical protein
MLGLKETLWKASIIAVCWAVFFMMVRMGPGWTVLGP